MSVIKIVNSKYEEPEDVQNLLNYVMSDKKNQERSKYVDAHLAFVGSNDDVYTQMNYIKKIHNQINGRQMYHVIVSAKEFAYCTEEEILEMGNIIAKKLFKDNQTIYSVHNDTDYKHIHFAINNIKTVYENITYTFMSNMSNLMSKYIVGIYANLDYTKNYFKST